MNKEEFIKGFEKKVYRTIDRFRLIKRNEKIAVAISGGKDSSTILYLLGKRYKNRVIAISIDEGTGIYREKSIKNAKRVSSMVGVEHYVYGFKDEYGYALPEIIDLYRKNNDNTKPCTICGILRRSLLNKVSKELKVNVLAVGHNLDDEAQSILMSLFKGNPEFLQRLGPRSNEVEGFIPRIKPLYLVSEKEVLMYALMKGLVDESLTMSCPFSEEAYRNTARRALRELERIDKGVKEKIIKGYLSLKKDLLIQPTRINKCKMCGEPSSGEICSKCKVLMKIEEYKRKSTKNGSS